MTGSNLRKLLICDSQLLFANNLKRLLEIQPQIKITEIIDSGANIISKVFTQIPDVLIMNSCDTTRNDLYLLPEIRNKYPELIIIILADFHAESTIIMARKNGANAFLSIDASTFELHHTIFDLSPLDFYLGKKIKITKEISSNNNKADKFDKFALITNREKEVIKKIALGKSGIQIANDMNISPATVHTHRKNIFKKLQINKISELIRDAYDHQII